MLGIAMNRSILYINVSVLTRSGIVGRQVGSTLEECDGKLDGICRQSDTTTVHPQHNLGQGHPVRARNNQVTTCSG